MTKKSVRYILFLFSLCFKEITSKTFSLENVHHAISGLDAKHPLILNEKSSSNINLIKVLSQDLHYSKIILKGEKLKLKTEAPTLVSIGNPNEIYKFTEYIKASKSFILILVEEINFEATITRLKVQIDQRVFIVKLPSLEIFETYCINYHLIKRKLGKIFIKSSEMIWDDNVQKDFVKRRSNFHGNHLKVMTEAFGVTMILDPKYKTQAPYFPENRTYLVNNFISGIHHDILKSLQNQLNFTANIYKRDDGVWGFVQKHSNETYTSSGMVRDVFLQNADLIAAELTYSLERSLLIDFTVPINPTDISLYIPYHVEEMAFDFDTFLVPFQLELWIIILILTILISILKVVVIGKSSLSYSTMVGILWGTFSVLVIGSKTYIHRRKSYKIISVTSMLGGVVIWIAYRAFLSAELAIVIKKNPFRNLESLSNTNFR